jgi:hypothetical protein
MGKVGAKSQYKNRAKSAFGVAWPFTASMHRTFGAHCARLVRAKTNRPIRKFRRRPRSFCHAVGGASLKFGQYPTTLFDTTSGMKTPLNSASAWTAPLLKMRK